MTVGANQLTSRATTANVEGPPTPVVQFRAFVDAFERLGYEVDRLLADVGLSRSELDDPDALIPCAVCGAFFGRTQQIRPLKNLWVRLAAETPIGAFLLLDYLILTSNSIADGFKQLARHVRLVDAPYPLLLDIRDDEDPIRVVYLIDGPSAPSVVEYSVTLNVRHFRAETENRATFAYISFTHQPDDAAEIERLLGCPVRTGGSWAGLALPREAWHVPLRRRDPILRSLLEGQTEAVTARVPSTGSLALDVRRVLASRLARGEMEIEIVARALGMSTRTLQRRLSVAGLSYQELLDATRREAGEKCITDSSLSIAEVAYLLGYSEPAAFHRAFKRWTGVTPQAFRQRQRRDPMAAPAAL
jgi:AraC-like DNA-binding protein